MRLRPHARLHPTSLPAVQAHVVAEVCDLDDEELIKMVGPELVETVVSHDIIGRLMIQCARQPGLAAVWEHLMGFDGAPLAWQSLKAALAASALSACCVCECRPAHQWQAGVDREAVNDVLLCAGAEFYLREWPELVGKPFGEVKLAPGLPAYTVERRLEDASWEAPQKQLSPQGSKSGCCLPAHKAAEMKHPHASCRLS